MKEGSSSIYIYLKKKTLLNNGAPFIDLLKSPKSLGAMRLLTTKTLFPLLFLQFVAQGLNLIQTPKHLKTLTCIPHACWYFPFVLVKEELGKISYG
jgi:hypothetical protein